MANRTFARSRGLVSDAGFGEAVELPELADALAAADVVVASTGASRFVVDEDGVRAAMERRPRRPLFIVDIAVPRDVDPEVAGIPGIALVDIDALAAVVDETLESRRAAVPFVEEIIDEHLRRLVDWYQTRSAVPVIASLTQKADAIREAELQRLFSRCPDLSDRQRMLIKGMSLKIVSRLLHTAVTRIREKAATDRAEAQLHARIVDELFDLGAPLTTSPSAAEPADELTIG